MGYLNKLKINDGLNFNEQTGMFEIYVTGKLRPYGLGKTEIAELINLLEKLDYGEKEEPGFSEKPTAIKEFENIRERLRISDRTSFNELRWKIYDNRDIIKLISKTETILEAMKKAEKESEEIYARIRVICEKVLKGD